MNVATSMENLTYENTTPYIINNKLKKLTSFLMYVSCFTAFALMVFITVDVFMRTVFNSPILGSLEVSELAMVILCFAAFPFTQNQDEQLGIDLFTSKLSDSTNDILSIFTNLIAAIYCAILSGEMFQAAVKFFSRDDKTTIAQIPVWPFMAFATVMMGFLACIILLNVWMAFVRAQQSKRTSAALFALVLGVVITVLPFFLAGTSLGLSKVALGGLSFVYLIGLAFLGMPIGYAMLVTGVQVLLLLIPNIDRALAMIGASPFYATSSILMVVIPMFVMMGEFALYGNISTALFKACKTWAGATPGGLAIASVGGCAGFAAVCGDTWVTALTMSSVAMPAMEESKYNKAFAAACLSIGGPLGILIPPSFGFILYSIVTEVSVGRLFIAGIIPGLLLALFLMIIIYIRVRLKPSLAPRGQSYTWMEKIKSTAGVIPMLGLFAIIIGSILTGIATPNEGGAVASFACLLYTFYLGTMNKERLKEALMKTMDITSKSFIIFIGVGVLGYALTASRFPSAISDYILSIGLSKYGVLIAIILMFTLLGCMMNATPMLLLALPAVFPTVVSLGFDTVWFGVLCVIMMELAAVTPPVGLVVYALSTVIKDVPIASIFYQLIPLYLGILALLILLILFPEIATYLPDKLFN